MSEVQDPRFPYFVKLQERAREASIAGLKFEAGKTMTGQPGCIVTGPSKNVAAHIEVVWPAHYGTYSSRPYAGSEAQYRLVLVRLDRKNICFPDIGSGVTSDVDEVLEALVRWRDSVPDTPNRTVPPIGDTELKRLKAIAAARTEAASHPESVEIEPSISTYAGLTGVDEESLRWRIAVEFPREDDGRLPLGSTVLMARMGESQGNEMLRSDWLAAVGPVKRRDPQTITVGIRDVIPANHPYRWDDMPSVWNPKLAAPSDAERWGVDGLTFDGGDPPGQIERLRKLNGKGGATEADKAMLCMLLLDAGLFGEALDLYRIEASDDVWRIATGGMLHPGLDREREAWTESVRRALWQCAPWKIARLVAERSASAKKAPRLRLFALPMQPQQSKTSLMLVAAGKSKTPTFDVEGNGSNLRLAELLWQRPVDLDIRRFGLG